MEGLKFTEDHERQVILCSTPKRKVKIKIFVPVGAFARWKILYEDGKEIDGLSTGSFTSRKLAIEAVKQWEQKASKTKEAKQFELFGDKEPPVLKRKKRVRGSTD
jgi:hypothetical protein